MYARHSPHNDARAWLICYAWDGSSGSCEKLGRSRTPRASVGALDPCAPAQKYRKQHPGPCCADFGIRMVSMLRGRWDAKVGEAIAGHPTLISIMEPLQIARTALRDEVAIIDKRVLGAARQDPVCKRLMSVPGVGPIVALTYRAAVDDPRRFNKVCRRVVRPDPAPIPIWRNRSCRLNQPRRRCFRPRRSLRSGPRHDGEIGEMAGPEGLGDEDRQAPRAKVGESGARKKTCGRPPSHVD